MTQEEMEFFEKLFRSVETEMNSQFDAVNARLDHMSARIGGLVNGGGRVIAKMIEWTEKTDVSLADVLRKTDVSIADVLRRQAQLEERVRKLEGGK